jgi:hypothetical protein
VIIILLSLLMMLLKSIMREENMVVGVFMLLKHLSLHWKFQSCSCFMYPYLLLCASLIYFPIRFLCIGSGLDLSVFYISSLMLFFLLQFIFLVWASSQITEPSSKALKKSTLGR